MVSVQAVDNRRRDTRRPSDDLIRWKRPGRIEDHKGWSIDASASSLGFLADRRSAPCVGERLNVRRLDGERWTTIDRPVWVARTMPASSDDLVFVGCMID